MDKKSEDKTLDKQSVISQFSELIKSDIDQTLIILKKWLHNIDTNEKVALQILAKDLREDELTALFSKLNYQERNIWKKFSTQEFSVAQNVHAETFIRQEVVKSLLEKSENADPELFDMIINLDNKDIKVFVQTHSELSSTLLNLLPPHKLSDFFSTLKHDEVLSFIQDAYDEKLDKESKSFKKLKMRLREYHLQKKEKTFNSKLDDMIVNLPPNKEDLIYIPLFKNKDEETILRIATKHFPSQLIERLPENILNNILKQFPDNKRIPFLASLPAKEREFYLNTLAPLSTPLREVTQMGIDDILNDKSKFQAITREQKQLNTDFVHFLRSNLTLNTSYQEVTKRLIKDWITEQFNR